MALETNNFYGKITIAEEAISAVAGFSTLESYGVVDLVNKSFKDGFRDLILKNSYSKGIKIENIDNKISIDIYCILKYGISINAVAESLKKTIKYKVESFTGLIVSNVNVHVVGVRV